jgi:hypothetical protein
MKIIERQGRQKMKKVPAVLMLTVTGLISCTHLKKEENEIAILNQSKNKIVQFTPQQRIPAAEKLDWWTATSKQVFHAKCRQTLPVSTPEIYDYFMTIL